MADPQQQEQQQAQAHPSLTDTPITAGPAQDHQSVSTRYHSEGRLPPVIPHKGEDQTQRATASQKAYDWATQVDEGAPKRSRDALGPEEQGDFGKPYTDKAHAFAAEAFLRTVLLPAVLAKFGPEVASLWSAYLSRNPGDSLKPRIFEGKSHVADAFRRCAETQYEQQTLVADVSNILLNDWDNRIAKLPVGQWVVVPLADLGIAERQLQTNFGNPNNIPGHIAGGVGSSDGGPDTRSVGGSVRIRRVDDETFELEPQFQFKVNDAIDFIPGDIGTRLESTFTIPLSRLEASGWAYDVPFEVRYPGPVEHETFKRTAPAMAATRFEESTRNDNIRNNVGNIPDQQTPGAKSSAETMQDRTKHTDDVKHKVTHPTERDDKQHHG